MFEETFGFLKACNFVAVLTFSFKKPAPVFQIIFSKGQTSSFCLPNHEPLFDTLLGFVIVAKAGREDDAAKRDDKKMKRGEKQWLERRRSRHT